ncbi:FecR family protein [Chitinophaga alhagiae]|uniref:FecR family protein n=1 Tax=Chitinophaga alhagiae TaxID=2203219 RepID=UPI000E5BF9E4|nr:FecR domain-containing protein [Chitinophaga alhagiae]
MEERIKYLFRQYTAGKCSRKEYEEFFAYVRRSSGDEALRDLVRELYAAQGQEPPAAPPYVDGNGALVLRKAKRGLRWSMAAAAVLLLGVALWWQPAPPLTRNHTARSEFKHLLLPDSTQVWLNAASTLEYPAQFSGGKREVYLSGEAYFDVQHAEQVPFVIHTGSVSTTVLGTAFNIKAYPGLKNIIVSVNRGKVSVNYGHQQAATLTGGQQLKVDRPEETVPAAIKTAITEAAPWKQGNLAYDNETMEDIVKDLERVYNVNIRIMEPGIEQIRISTSFRRNVGAEKALEVLCRLTDKQLLRSEGIYIIQ